MGFAKYALAAIWVTLTNPLEYARKDITLSRFNEFRFSGQKNVRYSLVILQYAHRVHLLCGAQTSVPFQLGSLDKGGRRAAPRRPLSNAFGGERMAAVVGGVAQSSPHFSHIVLRIVRKAVAVDVFGSEWGKRFATLGESSFLFG